MPLDATTIDTLDRLMASLEELGSVFGSLLTLKTSVLHSRLNFATALSVFIWRMAQGRMVVMVMVMAMATVMVMALVMVMAMVMVTEKCFQDHWAFECASNGLVQCSHVAGICQ